MPDLERAAELAREVLDLVARATAARSLMDRRSILKDAAYYASGCAQRITLAQSKVDRAISAERLVLEQGH